MKYLVNLFKALFMIMNSTIVAGNSGKDIRRLIKFLSSKTKKEKVLTLTLAEIDTNSNCTYKDIKRYIEKFGDGNIGIVKDIKLTNTEIGTMRYTTLTLYKGRNNRSELLYLALEPLLRKEKEKNNKIVNIDEYKHDKIAIAI